MNNLSSLSTKELYGRFVLPCYGRFDLFIERGEGSRVWAEDGTEYLDFGAGIAVCSLGHAHPEVARAASAQAAKLVHSSNLYFTRPQAELAARLVSKIGMDGKVFFSNSGAEANEGLIKLARKFGNGTGGRFEILTFEGSFHGRTMAGISATGQEKVKNGFAPLLQGFRHLPFGDLDAVRAAVGEETAAILVEPVQGEGGIHAAAPEFLRGLREVCDRHNLLLLFDEVQCGLGRTGNWGGWQTIAGQSVLPDGVSWAKGIANGFPLGAFWVQDRAIGKEGRLWELLGPGSHATTYGGNPVCCSAGIAVIDIIERENLLANATGMGALLRDGARSWNSPLVADVRAIGLMVGIELSPDFLEPNETKSGASPARAATLRLMQKGLLVVPAGERVIRLLPPLNVKRGEVLEALGKLEAVLNP